MEPSSLQAYVKVLLTRKFRNASPQNLLGATKTNLSIAILMVSSRPFESFSIYSFMFVRYYPGESYLDLLQRVDGVVQALLLNTGTKTFSIEINLF